MNKEYYIPEIEDIYLGYEFEFCSLVNPFTPEWVFMTLIKDNPYRFENSKGILEVMQTNIEKGYIRTPYLTKEQIENEGWKSTNNSNKFTHPVEVSLELNYDFDTHYLWITYPRYIVDEDIYYKANKYVGKCPSINEFRKICKLLEIK